MTPHQLRNPTIQFTMAAAALVAIAAIGLGSRSGVPGGSAGGTGRLEVDGRSYLFAPTTCTITDTDFLAAGSGELDGEPFWVSASGDHFNLTVGRGSEAERPEADELWMISVDEVAWRADDGGVTASAVMRDERDAQARSFRGSLSVECPAA